MNEKLNIIDKLIAENHLDAIALIPGPNFTWLTGMEKFLMERPTVLIYKPGEKAALIIAGFEVNSMKDIPVPFEPFAFDDNPMHWAESFKKAGKFLKLEGKRIGVESIHFRFLETSFLKQNIPGCEIVAGDNLFRQLRMHKNEQEKALMRKAALIAQNALTETLKIAKPGVTEREIASELVVQLFRNGSDPTLPFNPIVASGPNTADPHAEVSDRKLQKGDFLLVDWGARYQGYCSDITRTFGIGEISDHQHLIYETVRKANRAAVAQAKPGVSAGSVDKAARDVITAAGFGQYFTHRVGHGLGLEAHEDPYMFSGNEQILETGMSFTDEPGIYITGDAGVRIEDDVIVTEDGCITGTDFPRELQII